MTVDVAQNSRIAPVGIFGGTFDPIHFGHLRPALELMQELELGAVRFVPASVPPHRGAPGVAASHRSEMVRLAIAGQEGFGLDERELHRDGPSYMVDTLRSIRAELGETVPLCLMLGGDAFLQLESWHRWEEIPALAHLVVAHRPGWDLAESREDADHQFIRLRMQRLRHPEELRERPAGGVMLKAVSQLDISATAIRALIRAGRSPRYLLPDAVWQYIQDQGLYR